MARLRRLLNDLRRIAQGFVGFLEYLLSRDLVEIGLGQLSAESAVAVRGRQNRYLVTISNARIEPRDVTLGIVDLDFAEILGGLDEHARVVVDPGPELTGETTPRR